MTAPADPVRVLLHRHRELCEHATDPLEIAAALEAFGLTDAGAARFRHRDVFSLAEELYARTPRPGEHPQGPAPGLPPRRSRHRRHRDAARPAEPLRPPRRTRAHAPGGPVRPLLPLFPAALVSAGVVVADARAQAALTAAAVLAAGFLLYGRGRPRIAALCVLPLLALLWHRAGPGALLPPVAAVAPAVWCRDWFAARARRRLAASRSLKEFAAAVRHLLGAALLLFTLCLAALRAALWPLLPPAATTWTVTGQSLALGVLLFLSVLLAAHGFHRAAAAGPLAACAVHLLLAATAPPAEALLHAAASGATAALLLIPAGRALVAASAHHHDHPHPRGRPPRPRTHH
ncbi:hypothetical protein ACFV0Z_11450 [Streptomyces xiamenensis]|uniref:hypothetical protein n=1 Tax=Streptomyces xiamenensis TaxID=408015 RepID=UPI0036C2CE78